MFDPLKLGEMTIGEIASMAYRATAAEIATVIVQSKALNIRDVANGEEPYHYSSGFFGPGYVMIKGLVGRQRAFTFLTRQLALKLAPTMKDDFIAGLVTGGLPPSLDVRRYLQELQGREIPWVYIRDARKSGGAKETVTGIIDIATDEPNPEIPPGSTGAVVEELTNLANSLCNGSKVLRECGFQCRNGYSILDYANALAIEACAEAELNLTCLITLPELLDAAEEAELFPKRLIDDYRWFRRDPGGYGRHYNLERKEHTRA